MCLPLYTDRKINDLAKTVESNVIAWRRSFHEIPEPSWVEKKTLALIRKELEAMIKESSLPIDLVETKGGIWVDVTFDPAFPWVLFRSDIDGLPIEEETDLPYRSKHKGFMHACGHDCHIAMLLGAFKLLTKEPAILSQVNIRFVWQRAEEYGKNPSGGLLLVQEGVCEDIDFAYALHISSTLKLGCFYSKKDLLMANSSYIECRVRCSGGHVMRPDLGANAISVMSDILFHLKGVEKEFFDPGEPIIFLPSIASSGTKSNIRPDSATFCFAFRNFLPEQKRVAFANFIKAKIETLLSLYPSATLASFNFHQGYPPLYNDPDNYDFVQNALMNQRLETEAISPIFAAEDFAYYLQRVPGSFWSLGAKQGHGFDHHTSKFNPDERALVYGVAFWLTLSQSTPSQQSL